MPYQVPRKYAISTAHVVELQFPGEEILLLLPPKLVFALAEDLKKAAASLESGGLPKMVFWPRREEESD